MLAVIGFLLCFVGVFGFAAKGSFFAAVVCGTIIVLPFFIRKCNIAKIAPSVMVCPNCGSTQVRISRRTESVTNNSVKNIDRSILMPHHHITVDRKSDTQINRQRVAICQSCGFDYPYITAQEVSKKQRSAKIIVWVLLVIVIMCFASGTRVFYLSDTIDDQQAKAAAPTVATGIVFAELSDFDYYIDDNEITLKDYKGREKYVGIAQEYEIEGELMPVVALDGTFTLEAVDCIVVPEGVRSIASNTFNSCGVEYLYLPSTLNNFTGWTYFHGVKKLYYGGSEEQWGALFTGDRSRLDVVQIICNAVPSDVTEK